ncbi:hypothetical protein BHE74_00024701, partial [Ensete ventricosum]
PLYPRPAAAAPHLSSCRTERRGGEAEDTPSSEAQNPAMASLLDCRALPLLFLLAACAVATDVNYCSNRIPIHCSSLLASLL